MKKILTSLLLIAFCPLLFSTSILAAEVFFNGKAVDFDFSVGGAGGPPGITDVTELTVVGKEYRNTSGSTSIVDGVFTVTSLISGGAVIPLTGINNTWEMTGVYAPVTDYVIATDATSFSYITSMQPIGLLSFYVDDFSKGVRADLATGTGYADGLLVAQFAVYNPDPITQNTGGGVVKLISPFSGSRDMVMTIQYTLPGFMTSSYNPDEEVTSLGTDWNLDADRNKDGVPGNNPVPSAWPYLLDSPPLHWPTAYFSQNDGSITFGVVSEPPPGSCRMTGGGNDTNGNVILGTQATSDGDRYTYGGQIGAPSADQPQPYGEWTHHQQKGVGDKFIFHSGTHSSPPESKILNVFCQDPCYCVNARPAPFKQISWDGLGVFRNISPKGLNQLQSKCQNEIIAGNGGTLHYYRVHVNDIGEPGSGGLFSKGNGKKSTRSSCNLNLQQGFPETPYEITDDQCRDCPDTYQIEIHCTDNPASAVMYSVGAFVEGGNLQIHPPVGQHLKPGSCP